MKWITMPITTITSSKMIKTEVLLIDIFGNTHVSEKYNLVPGQTIQIPVTHLQAGLYFILVKNPGEIPIIRKVMIAN